MPHILVVEDEQAIAETLIYALEREGFTVSWLSLAGAALERLQKGDIDLVIMDVGLPDLSGFEACKQIRRHSEIPLLFLTARSEEIDRVVGFEIGGDDYVAKPFSPRELVARVRAILKRAHAKPPAQGGVLQVDAARQLARYHGKALSLTRAEFRLLETLHQRPGIVLSRAQLLEALGTSLDSFERSVDTHIKTLRAKLHDIAPEHELIVTHRGLGYSLKGRES